MSKDNGDFCVGVLGGGAFGTCLGHLAGLAGNETLLWLRDEGRAKEINEKHENTRYLKGFSLSERLTATTELAEVAKRCPLILVAIPSKAFRQVARDLGDVVEGDQALVSATKGLERGTFDRMSEILREETCCRKIGAISGPNLAVEIMQGVPAATVIASRYDEVVRLTNRALRGPHFRVYASQDVVGVELGGATKNVIAIAGGIVAGLGLGDNTRTYLVTRGLSEMARLGQRMGADPRTYAGLAGVGDLMVTAFSKLSRNFRVGLGLAEGKKLEKVLEDLGQVAEGVITARVVREWASSHRVTLPLCESVYRILYEDSTAGNETERLMSLPSTWEVDDRIIA